MALDFKEKAQNVADRMNKITEKFKANLDTADDMLLAGDDVEDFVQEQTKDVELYEDDSEPTLAELVNLQNLLKDFKYLRETLKENTDNGRKIINELSINMLKQGLDYYDPEGGVNPAEMVSSFAELNKALMENMRLYLTSYKEMSNIIMNLEKIKNGNLGRQSNTINISQVNTGDNPQDVKGTIISTAELIKQLSEK